MIVVSGYYGFANLGDEAILASLCDDIETLGFSRKEILVLSQNPVQTEKEHGVRALGRYNLPAIWRVLGSARALISGGGSLLQDVTSKRTIPYYLGVVEMAIMRRVPVVMYGQGLGPVQSAFYRKWIAKSFVRSAAYSVRDRESARFLAAYNVPEEKGMVTADPVFGRELRLQQERENRILLNLRPYQGWEAQRELWLELICSWQRLGYQVEFLPLGPGDRQLGEYLEGRLRHFAIQPDVSLANLVQPFQGARLCVSMRLHGVIFSALHDVLPLAVDYDPKVREVSGQLHVPCWDLEDLPSLTAGLEEIAANYEQHRLRYQKSLSKLREWAQGNQKVLARVLLRE